MATVRIGRALRRIGRVFDEAGLHALRQPRRLKRRDGDLFQRHLAIGAGDSENAFFSEPTMSASAASIIMRGKDFSALLDQLFRGHGQCRAAEVTIEREPFEPIPNATRSVSPSMKRISFAAVPSFSCRICLYILSRNGPGRGF